MSIEVRPKMFYFHKSIVSSGLVFLSFLLDGVVLVST